VNPDAANEMNDISTMNKVMEYMALGKPMVQFDLAEGVSRAQRASLYARPNNAFDLAEKIVELPGQPGENAPPWATSAASGCSTSWSGATRRRSSCRHTRRFGRRQSRAPLLRRRAKVQRG